MGARRFGRNFGEIPGCKKSSSIVSMGPVSLPVTQPTRKRIDKPKFYCAALRGKSASEIAADCWN
jgi:hypothetical protein